FWIALQGVWGEIDRIDPNPMKCKEDIQTYTKIRSEQKLFQFLNGLDRKFELIKREIHRVDPLPTAEDAYATVHKEAAHQIILGVTNNETHGIATGLITEETDGMASNKGAKKDKPSTSPTANTRKSTKNSNDRRSEGGFGGVAVVVEEEGEESFSVKDNLDENNADDIQDPTSEILQEHEEEVPRSMFFRQDQTEEFHQNDTLQKKPPGEQNIRWLT
nr:ribonuclease H-like domain-containing protein [Tanacetum cinerariifolium]